MPLRLIFMGTPAFSVPTLRSIHAAGHQILAVYTQPPRPAGRRGLAPTPSPVAVEAARLGLDPRTPLSLKGADEQAAFAALGADVAVVVAYGLILPQPILDAPRFGALNGHASLLPRWRGAAPIQRAIEAGDAVTGMMAMRMEAGLDTGPVALSEEIAIGRSETGGELQDRLAVVSSRLMTQALERLEAGTLLFEDQADIAARTGRTPVYAKKIDKAETKIDFAGEAGTVAAKINAFSPFPGAWTTTVLHGRPERVKLLRAQAEAGEGAPGITLDDALLVACGSGAVRLLELQRAGGRPITAAELLRGTPILAGHALGGA